MSALVLCDGDQSSLKAVEVAGHPGGLFMSQHDGSQLVVIHAWRKAATAMTTGAGPAAGGGDAAVATAVRTSSSGPNTGAAQTSPRPRGSVANDAGLDSASAAAAADLALGGARAASTELPASAVIQSVLTVIKENKSLRDTLLYKIETTAIAPPDSPSNEDDCDMNATHTATSPGRRGESPRKGTLSSTPRAAKKKDTTHGPGASTGSNPSAQPKTPEEQAEERLKRVEAAQKGHAQRIVAYAASRASHHACGTVVLGAGNGLDGKSVSIGHTAHRALATLRASHVLCFVKPDGYMPRRTAAVVRLLIVVPVCPVAAAAAAAAEVEEEAKEHLAGEKGGVSQTSGELHDAPPAFVVQSTQRADDTAARTDASALPVNVAASLEAGRAVVRYALRTLASTLVTAPAVQVNTAIAESGPALTAVGSNNNNNSNSSQSGCKVGVLLVADPSTPVETIQHFTQAFDALLGTESSPNAQAATAATTTNSADAADGSTEAAEEQWVPLTVMTLKASKQLKEPTITNSASQVTRAVQQSRAEYVLVADNAPSALHDALLSANKPHCLVIPHVKY